MQPNLRQLLVASLMAVGLPLGLMATTASGAIASSTARAFPLPRTSATVVHPMSAAPAGATVIFNSPPDTGSVVSGPGCPPSNTTHDDFDYGGAWRAAAGDYTGPHFYDASGGNCTGQTFFILDQANQTAVFRWHMEVDTSEGNSCRMWIYIPTQNAGDRHARYDFWADDGTSHLTWLGWPGATIDQQTHSGWTYVGDVNVPPDTYLFTITLSNADPSAPGWYAGAGDIAANCIG